MRRLIAKIEASASAVKDHAFIKILENTNVHESFATLQYFATSFIHLSMTFRDINQLYYMYDEPKNDHERLIDAHAREDAEHWHMLLHDLEALSVNTTQNTNDAIQRFWRDEDLYIREYIYSVLTRARRCSVNSVWRMASMEAGEAGVRTFFKVIRENARKINQSLGIQLRYFGEEHVEAEINTKLDTLAFEAFQLSDEDYAFCSEIVEDHYASNLKFLDSKALVASKLIEGFRKKAEEEAHA